MHRFIDTMSRAVPCAAVLVAGFALFTGCGNGSAPQTKTEVFTPSASVEPEREIAAPLLPAPKYVVAELKGADVRVTWEGPLSGDTNGDGQVSGLDVFPLAAHFMHSSGHNMTGKTDDEDSCIDLNRDGRIDGLDLFQVATGFNSPTVGYNVYSDSSEDGEFATKINGFTIGYAGCGEYAEYFDNDPGLPRSYCVSMVDVLDEQNESPKSNPISAKIDVDAPNWTDGVGVQAAASFNSWGVALYWNEAVDGKRNDVNYTVYWDTQLPIRYDGGATVIENVQHQRPDSGYDCMFWLDTLTPGQEYHFAVRASDDVDPPNTDRNTETVSITWQDWQTRGIEDSDTDVDPLHMSVAANEYGRRLLVYYDRGNALLKSGYTSGSNPWTIKHLSAEGEDAPQASAAIDDEGNAHAVYFDETAGNLIYAFDTHPTGTDDWLLRPLDDSPAAAGAYNSLVLDDELRPVASYVDLDNRELKLAWLRKGDSQIETIAGLDGDPVAKDSSTSIVLDNGTPTVLFREPATGHLKLATRGSSDPDDPGTWTVVDYLTTVSYYHPQLAVVKSGPDDLSPELYAYSFDDNNAARLDLRDDRGDWDPVYFHFVTGPVSDAGINFSRVGTALTTLHFPSNWLNIRVLLPLENGAFMAMTDGFSTGEPGSASYITTDEASGPNYLDYGVFYIDQLGSLVESRRSVPSFF